MPINATTPTLPAAPPRATAGPGDPPDASPRKPLDLTLRPVAGDSLVLTPAARARLAGPREEQAPRTPGDEDVALLFDAVAFDKAWKDEIRPQLARWPGRDDSPVAIQQVRYADRLAGGRETQMVFERDPGQLMPPTGLPQRPFTDPVTGESHLELREARVRVSAGRYDLILSVDGEGRPSFEKLFLDGKNITRHAGDFVKGKIKEDPIVWGSVTAATAAGLVVLAHKQAERTGKPIGFDAARVTVYERDGLKVKAKLRGELTGDSSFVRASGAEIGTTYVDGRLAASAGLRYGLRDKGVEAAMGLTYQVDKTSTFSAAAHYNQATKDYGVGVSFVSTF